MSGKRIDSERKTELLAVIRQQESNWVKNYSYSREGYTASQTLECDEPMVLNIGEESHTADTAILTVTVGLNAKEGVRISLPDGACGFLYDAVRDSEITENEDFKIGMALSFLGSELSQQMVSDNRYGPSDDPLLNMLAKFLK